MTHTHEAAGWRLVDAVVYLAVGVCLGLLAVAFAQRGAAPAPAPVVIPDHPGALVDDRKT